MSRTGRAVMCGAAVVTLAVLALPVSASAGTRDQHQTAVSCSAFIGGPDRGSTSRAQTFTAGVTGGLDQVDLRLDRLPGTVEPLSVEIRDVTSTGDPGPTVLASTSVPAADVPSPMAFVPVVFDPPVPVVSGTGYAIVAYTHGSSAYGWGCATGNPYPAGALFSSGDFPPSTWTATPDIDHTFITYVEPEPEAQQCLVDLDLPGLGVTVRVPDGPCLVRL